MISRKSVEMKRHNKPTIIPIYGILASGSSQDGESVAVLVESEPRSVEMRMRLETAFLFVGALESAVTEAAAVHGAGTPSVDGPAELQSFGFRRLNDGLVVDLATTDGPITIAIPHRLVSQFGEGAYLASQAETSNTN